MKTFQIILKSEMTRQLFADCHKTEGDEMVIYLERRQTEHFEDCAVLTLDELGETPDYLVRLPFEVWASIPFQ